MSKLALSSLILLTTCLFAMLWAPSDILQKVGTYGTGLFALSLLTGLVLGRRVKFDPVLR